MRPLATPGPRRDCHCPRVRHQHGTYAAYVKDKCRCLECRAACRDRSRARRAHGRAPGGLVDAAPVRARIAELRADGWNCQQVAAAAGVDRKTIAAAASAPRGATVTAWTARHILALHQPVTRQGAVRRIRALAATGWRMGDIATAAGLHKSHLQRVLGITPGTPTAATLARIARAYDRAVRHGTPPPSGRSRRAADIARAKGWPGPARWADIDRDDTPEPAASPLPGHTMRDDLAADLALGMTVHDIARARHITVHSAQKEIYRATGHTPATDERTTA